MAGMELEAAATGEDQASVGRRALSARDGVMQGCSAGGSAVPALAEVEAEQVAERYAIDGAEALDAVPDDGGDGWIDAEDGASAPGVLLVDTARLAREIGTDRFLGDPDERVEPTSPEDEQRRKFLRRHANATGGLFRRHLIADAGTLERLAALRAEAPNATRLLDIVERACLLSMHADSPLRLPPLLLVGRPGTGKTRVARRIAEALGAPLTTVDGGSTTDRGPFVGHDPGYRGAGPGQVALALLDGRSAGPVVLVDEVDKVAAYSLAVRPLDALLPLLEPGTADRFVDTYVGLPMRAAGVSWIMTANSTAGLPAPLLDRVVTAEMLPLGRAETRDAVRRLFRELLAEHGLPAAELGDAASRRLENSGLRQARRALALALGPALAAGRDAPDATAIAAAVALVARPAPKPRRAPREPRARPRAPVGFVHFASGLGDPVGPGAVRPHRGA